MNNNSRNKKRLLFLPLVAFLLTLICISLVSAGTLSDLGIDGMELKSFKVDGNSFTGLKDSSFLNFEFETEITKNDRGNLKQDIWLKNKWLFSQDLEYSQLIEIDYSEIRYNGTRYKLTSTPVELRCWIEKGETICPNIFMDDIYHKRINFKDIGEKGGYAVAYENKGKYYIELKIDILNVKSGEQYYIDPTYVNQTDGFSFSFLNSDSQGIWGNGTDFWLTGVNDYFVYHLDSNGNNITDGFSVIEDCFGFSELNGIWGNGTDFWTVCNYEDYGYINHYNLLGVNQNDGFSTSPFADSIYGIWGNGTDFWITDIADGSIEHTLINGTDVGDGYSTSSYGLGDGIGIWGNGTDFWISDDADDLVYHILINGSNLGDGFSTSGYSSSGPYGLWGNGTDFWITDITDDFVYHITRVFGTTPPNVSLLTETPTDPATYSASGVYNFNVTITDETGIDTVLFDFDGMNYSATNLTADVYNSTITVRPAGTYNYKWFANDTEGSMNNSESGTYTISKATGDVKTYINGNRENLSTTDTTTEINVSSRFDAGTGDVLLFVNNSLWNNGTAQWTSNVSAFAIGEWNITGYYAGNENYTGDSETWYIIVSDVSTTLSGVCSEMKDALDSFATWIAIIIIVLVAGIVVSFIIVGDAGGLDKIFTALIVIILTGLLLGIGGAILYSLANSIC